VTADDAPINGDHNEEDEPAPKRKRATRTKKVVPEVEADENTKVEKRARPARNAAKANGGRAKKTTQAKDTEGKTADNAEKPKRGRRKAALRKEAE
jgi:hypothetical protein